MFGWRRKGEEHDSIPIKDSVALLWSGREKSTGMSLYYGSLNVFCKCFDSTNRGGKDIPETIASVVKQDYENCEILILRNNISNLPEGIEVMEGNREKDARKIPI